jgi:hypothetical protein
VRSNEVTNARLINVRLDDTGRRLVGLLDGTRSHQQIAEALGIGHAPEMLTASLEWLASRGLLEG